MSTASASLRRIGRGGFGSQQCLVAHHSPIRSVSIVDVAEGTYDAYNADAPQGFTYVDLATGLPQPHGPSMTAAV